jgi:DNA-binding transcriptional MocR family regulator
LVVYKQFENQIQSAIASEVLMPEDSLPSVMELSEKHDDNPNMIATVYREFEVMGGRIHLPWRRDLHWRGAAKHLPPMVPKAIIGSRIHRR